MKYYQVEATGKMNDDLWINDWMLKVYPAPFSSIWPTQLAAFFVANTLSDIYGVRYRVHKPKNSNMWRAEPIQ